MDPQKSRYELAKSLASAAGVLAKSHFQSITELRVEKKGAQDLVSNADVEVETFIRKRLADMFPEDGIVGEEQGNKPSQSGWTWVIDPIDGTANFVSGIPAWCVVLACVHDDTTKVGVVYEPCHGEMFCCALGQGAFLNDVPIQVAETRGLDDGSLGVGMNGRSPRAAIVKFIDRLMELGGVFYRNASGALMLSYVASGRLIGYAEPHMNAWDCLAGQLLIAEAGGHVEQQSADRMLISGGRVVAGAPVIFDQLISMADAAFGDD